MAFPQHNLLKKKKKYGSETWTPRDQDKSKLMLFEMKCLRAILRQTQQYVVHKTDAGHGRIHRVFSVGRKTSVFGQVARNDGVINASS